jgi:hypothetical protein
MLGYHPSSIGDYRLTEPFIASHGFTQPLISIMAWSITLWLKEYIKLRE